MQTKNVF